MVVLLTPGITSVGEGSSRCMTDCNMGQHGPSQYKQYCCHIGRHYMLGGKKDKKVIFGPCKII